MISPHDIPLSTEHTPGFITLFEKQITLYTRCSHKKLFAVAKPYVII